jgi:hypothetical protein
VYRATEMDLTMETCTGTKKMKQLNIFTQLDHPVALSAPRVIDKNVLIGYAVGLEET